MKMRLEQVAVVAASAAIATSATTTAVFSFSVVSLATAFHRFVPPPHGPGILYSLERRKEIEGGWNHPAKTPMRASSIHLDEEGNCVFGKKEYWDRMYGDEDIEPTAAPVAEMLPSDSYSWYCGWEELRPFWTLLVPNRQSRVVVAGIGNDPSPVGLYDSGWTKMIAYDYSQRGVDRAAELFGPDRVGVELMTADARDLPMKNGSVDATLDKGTLDAIYISGRDTFRDSVAEMGRVTAPGGVVVSISRVIWPDDLLGEFDSSLWENIHDGSLSFAADGEPTINLGAELYSWRRTSAPYEYEDE